MSSPNLNIQTANLLNLLWMLRIIVAKKDVIKLSIISLFLVFNLGINTSTPKFEKFCRFVFFMLHAEKWKTDHWNETPPTQNDNAHSDAAAYTSNKHVKDRLYGWKRDNTQDLSSRERAEPSISSDMGVHPSQTWRNKVTNTRIVPKPFVKVGSKGFLIS